MDRSIELKNRGAIEKKENSYKKKIELLKKRFRSEKQLWLVASLMIVWVIIFSYIPMYGLLMAFFKYTPGKPILAGEFVGLKYFIQFFTSPDFKMVLRNTLVMSGLRIFIVFPLPILFALLLNEVRIISYKRVVQTISYLPHFISWTVTASLLFVFLSSDGILSKALYNTGLIDNPTNFLGQGKSYWLIYTIAHIWKSLGWSSIIYLAAISGVDNNLYEAAAIDGVGRFGMMRHITIPSIMSTIVILFILQIGSILSAGFEEHLLLGSNQTRAYWDVIDTYAYRYGIQLGRYSYATAITLFKSGIGLALVVVSNKVSKKYTEMTIF